MQYGQEELVDQLCQDLFTFLSHSPVYSSEAEKPMPLSSCINHSRLDTNSDPISQFYMGVGKESVEIRLPCLRPLLSSRGIPLAACGGVNSR